MSQANSFQSIAFAFVFEARDLAGPGETGGQSLKALGPQASCVGMLRIVLEFLRLSLRTFLLKLHESLWE